MATFLGVPAYSGNEGYLFLSYANADAKKISEIVKELHNIGVNCWYDAGLEFGKSWQAQIADRIRNCSAFLCFLSQNSFAKESPFWKQEVQIAQMLHIPIIPVYIDDLSDNEIPVHHVGTWIKIKDYQGIIATDIDAKATATKICDEFYHLPSHSQPGISTVKPSQLGGSVVKLKQGVSLKTRQTLKRIMFSVLSGLILFFTVVGLHINSIKPAEIIRDIASYDLPSLLSSITFPVLAIVYVLLFAVIAHYSHPLYGMKAYKTKEEADNISQHEKNRISSRKITAIFVCIIPLLAVNIATYLLCFAQESSESQIFFPFITICAAVIGAVATLYIDKMSREVATTNGANSRAVFRSVINIFSLVINVIIIFAIFTHVINSGNSSAYEPIAYSNWFDKAFVFFYHSFSMCFRNESDVTTPISSVARMMSMGQFGVMYFLILNSLGKMIPEISKS